MISAQWVSFAVLPAGAFPSFRHNVPNGARVPCPDTSGCRPGDADKFNQPKFVCSGLGHKSCTGGDLPLNPFGEALKAAEFLWTKELCEADSDGDGLTNGEELGDPCCLWEAYDTPSDYMNSFIPSHPGIKFSLPMNYTRPTCSSTAPTTKSTRLGEFNSGEEQRQVDLIIDNYEIPARATTYINFAWNFPDDSHEIFHVVFAEAIVHQKEYLHHYVIKACSEKFPESQHGRVVYGGMSCRKRFGLWTPGKKIVEMTPWAGEPVGRGVGIVAFEVQVHYDNQMKKQGVISRDGMRLHYTPALRPQGTSIFSVMELSVNSGVEIPPCKHRFFITRQCEIQVTDPTGEGANLMSTGFHAHLLGNEMWSEIYRDGQSMDLGSDQVWHFDDQYDRNMLDLNFSFREGDVLQSTCVYDSTERREPTKINKETTDEMCWAQYKFWPSTTRVACKTGNIWTGELKDGESGFLLPLSHTAADAPTLLSGTSSFSGGYFIRRAQYSDCNQEEHDAVSSSTTMPIYQSTGGTASAPVTPVGSLTTTSIYHSTVHTASAANSASDVDTASYAHSSNINLLVFWNCIWFTACIRLLIEFEPSSEDFAPGLACLRWY